MPALGTLFLLLTFLAQAWYDVMCVVLLYLTCHVWLTGLCFYEWKWKRSGSGVGRGSGGGGGKVLGREEGGGNFGWDVVYEREFKKKI